jgi:hypothetical protein
VFNIPVNKLTFQPNYFISSYYTIQPNIMSKCRRTLARTIYCHGCEKKGSLNSTYIHCLKCNNYFCPKCTFDYNDEPCKGTWERLKIGKYGESIDVDGSGCDACVYWDNDCEFSKHFHIDCECSYDTMRHQYRCGVKDLKEIVYMSELKYICFKHYVINLPVSVLTVLKTYKQFSYNS